MWPVRCGFFLWLAQEESFLPCDASAWRAAQAVVKVKGYTCDVVRRNDPWPMLAGWMDGAVRALPQSSKRGSIFNLRAFWLPVHG